MIFRHIFSGFLLISLLFVWGCAQPVPKAKTWMDIADISGQIVKDKRQATVLESAEEETGAKVEGPKVKDLSEKTGGANPYLQHLAVQLDKAPQATAAGEEGEGVLLNFDNADIYEFIQVLADELDLSYILDPNIKGVVNIKSSKKIGRDKLFDVFKKILNINNLDIRNEGDYYYIHVAEKPSSRIIYDQNQIGKLKDTPRVVTQVIPVMNISSAEAVKLITPYLSAQGVTFNLESQNTIIISDFESKVIDALEILSRLDISPLAALKIRLIKVEKAPLFDLRDDLTQILTTMRINKKEFEGVSVLALERLNSLLLAGTSEKLLDSAETWIRELDVVPSEGRDNIYIYNVRNSVASELADLVNNLIGAGGRSGAGKTTARAQTTTTAPKTASRSRTASQKKVTPSSLQFAGEPILLPDDSRNIILLRALRDDYNRLRKLLERLDNLPRQVLIEVMVAEVTLDHGWSLGIEWAIKNHELTVNHSGYGDSYISDFDQLGQGLFGFTYNIVSSNENVSALLNTLASKSDVSILSSPQVLVLNNETATVNVGSQVPIVTTETASAEGTTTDKTVQYKDTGVIMEVTPRINYNGIIILDIDQQVSEARKNTTGGIDSPEILNRQIKTKLAVKDGQSILMGGLISNHVDNAENGIPYLMDAPILGWFFKYKSKSTTKTELLVMITPYVIESENELDQYIRKFKEKVAPLRRELTGADAGL